MNTIPYMRAVLKETMRLAPVVNGNLRATGKDIVLQGYQIPKGTEVVMCSLGLQTEEANFPQSDEFIPERWLKDPVAAAGCPSAKTAHPFIYLPFGFGSRACIGRRFAEMEVEILLARLLRDQKVEWNYGKIKYANTLIISPTGDLKFKFTELDH